MSEPLTLDQMIRGASRAKELVPICFRLDVLADIRRLELELEKITDADVSDTRLGGATERSAVDVAEEIRELEQVAEDNTIQLELQAVDSGRWAENISAHTDDQGNTQLGDALRALLPESITAPEFTSVQIQNMLAVLSDGQWDRIGKALLFLNRETASVPKSLTAFVALQAKSGKQESEER
jgi:hypothetical protein